MKAFILIMATVLLSQTAQAGEPFYNPKGSLCPPGSYKYGPNHCIQYQDTKRRMEMERISNIQDQIMKDSRERHRREREILQKRHY